jgi:hypothetical protein
MRKIDLTGKKFGRLLVLSESKTQNGNILWKCKCDCGNIVYALAYNLKSQHTSSCGCYRNEVKSLTHSTHLQSKTRLYKIWRHIKSRCYNPNLKEYKNYGERGISMCEEWYNNFKRFFDWSYQNGYTDFLTIDRINNNGNYEPSNCRWADYKTQANNRRNTDIIEYNGVSKPIMEWSEILNIPVATIRARLYSYKWSVDKALSTPVRQRIKQENIFCKCGCGTIIEKYNKYGRERKYVNGHNN